MIRMLFVQTLRSTCPEVTGKCGHVVFGKSRHTHADYTINMMTTFTVDAYYRSIIKKQNLQFLETRNKRMLHSSYREIETTVTK